ncbi:hypothetical protein [Xanthomonas cannabis]|uniref:Uncharacterized protein n=1 Tax=Xanthomonas cannabis TaxID=1885674 RepID=A0ABR6JIK2_9XANT|nr:hypothetical protein [Xanthomonas cannabis]MBB4592617.1 hypothetical protein [Xanthomonas cannabis]MBB5520501.1 hypothetical protein [Xanthomonas cannabis]
MLAGRVDARSVVTSCPSPGWLDDPVRCHRPAAQPQPHPLDQVCDIVLIPLSEAFTEDQAFYGVMQGVVDGLDASVKLKP